MSQPASILVVDDDPRVRDMLARYLAGEGFAVRDVASGAAMRRALADAPADLIILDLVMPGEDGLTLARALRATSDVPIIMITGKGEVVDRIVGLEVGADDYITKPFHLREVLARIRTVLRRAPAPEAAPAAPAAAEAAADRGACVAFSGWRFDMAKRALSGADGGPVPLTTGEFNLLQAFVTHPNRPLNRDQLMDLSRDRDWAPFDRSIDTQVGRLRKKIEADPKNPQLIKTVRGVGYVFAATVDPA